MPYPILITIHIFSAIAFIGVVFFEVIFLESIRKRIPVDTMQLLQEGITTRRHYHKSTSNYALCIGFFVYFWFGYGLPPLSQLFKHDVFVIWHSTFNKSAICSECIRAFLYRYVPFTYGKNEL
jgi:hypothetical protein